MFSFRCKENLPSQFSTKHENRQLRPIFKSTQRWVFVKKGLDDFRNGCPSCENMITRGLPEHPAPQRYSRGPRPPPTKRPSYLPTGAALCSRLSAAQQARKAFLEEIEAQLTRHPLARYPDLEESIPLEVMACPRCGRAFTEVGGGGEDARKNSPWTAGAFSLGDDSL